jgi:hypothetical protein
MAVSSYHSVDKSAETKLLDVLTYIRTGPGRALTDNKVKSIDMEFPRENDRPATI